MNPAAALRTVPAQGARALVASILVLALAGCLGGGGGSDGGSADTGATSAAGPTSGSTNSNGSTNTGGSSNPANPSTLQPLGVTRSGEGTYYAATGDGACSFGPSPGDLMVAAMNQTDYAGSAACGAFVRLTGPNGTIVVRIVDKCPECKPGDVDLSAQAFAMIANPAAGRVPITWQFVAGEVQGPVTYKYKDGSHQFWQAIQVRNHRVPVAKLEILPSGASNWITLDRADYNYFIHPTAVPNAPMQVRVTAVTGATVQNMLPAPQSGLDVGGTAQFP